LIINLGKGYFFTQIMKKIKKVLNAQIILLAIAVLFIFNSAAYGIDLPKRSNLRISIGESDTYKRIADSIKTLEEQRVLIGPNVGLAHKDDRAELLHKEYLPEGFTAAKAATTQSLDKLILFNGDEVAGKLGSFSEMYAAKSKDDIFVIVTKDISQKEALEKVLKEIGLIPDSDDLKVKILRGPALQDYEAMLSVGEAFGDFTVVRGRNINETRANLRNAAMSI